MTGRHFLLFLFLSFATFRLQRVITADTWLPSRVFREWVDAGQVVRKHRTRFRLPKLFWQELYELITCPWCFGAWTAAAVTFIVDRYYFHLPLPVLWWAAISGVVGIIARYVEE